MNKTKITIVCLTLLLGVCSANAQRHYTGVSALELNYGLNVFGKPNTNLNFAYSKYKNRTTYWKLGFNYLENTHGYKVANDIPDDVEYLKFNTTAKSYYADINYFKTLATNLTWLYLNGGIGAFMGVETYKEPFKNPDREHQFLLGPKVDMELECFVTPRVAIMGRLTQYWNPFSDTKKWNTVWNAGVKFLIY